METKVTRSISGSEALAKLRMLSERVRPKVEKALSRELEGSNFYWTSSAGLSNIDGFGLIFRRFRFLGFIPLGSRRGVFRINLWAYQGRLEVAVISQEVVEAIRPEAEEYGEFLGASEVSIMVVGEPPK